MATKGGLAILAVLALVLSHGLSAGAQGECSRGSPCPNAAHCCSKWGYCGTGDSYCGDGCQAGPCSGGGGPIPPGPPTPPAPPSGSGLGAILTRSLYQQLFPNHIPFYSYDALIEAAKTFPEFGTTGDTNTRKREIAAYAAHVTHETSGLTKITEQTSDKYCDTTREAAFPCGGNSFNGRGPLQLSWNYNYGTAGHYLKLDLLNNPNLVATDSVISFKTSLWFWDKYGDAVIPHIHDVITGNWKPSNADRAANRVPGFGVTIDIINGGLECNKNSAQADSRVNNFRNFCRMLSVDPGANLDCKRMKPFYSFNLVAKQ